MALPTRGRTVGAATLVAGVLLATLAPVAASADSHDRRGSLVMIGGNLKEDAQILQRIVDLAEQAEGADGTPRIAVITAAANTAKSAEDAADATKNNAAANGLYYGELFGRYGAETYAVPVDSAVDYEGDAYIPANANDRAVAERIEASDGVFLGGGDQMRYVRTMLQCKPAADEAFTKCKDTAVMAAVRKVLAKGGVVAGVSAGTTIQQGANMVTGGEPYQAWRDGAAAGYFDDATKLGYLPYGGFGFFTAGGLDSHFGTWGRQARAVRLALDTREKRIFGVDETTALVVDRARRTAEVIGRNGVSLIDVSRARGKAPTVAGVRWSYLVPGDRIDLVKGRITAAGDPLQGAGPSPQPVADVWDSIDNDPVGSYSLVDLAIGLVSSAGNQGIGTTYETGPQYQTTLVVDGRTRAWDSEAGAGFADLELRISPVG